MRWVVHGERSLYHSDWVGLSLVDVEIPGGARFEHHVVRGRQAVGTVVHDQDRGVLLIYRHRFISDTWGYEVPAGSIEPGEEPAAAAAREVLEETGWQPGRLTARVRFFPSNGLSDQQFHVFVAAGATYVGDPLHPEESERVEWVPLSVVEQLLVAGSVSDGLSLAALSHWLLTAPK
jgi:8-oxo-dGTP pyrophosphatase MutT (NUDIX family)